MGQLVSFLAREPEDREGKAGAGFDESMCTPGCLEVLKAYGLGTDGRPLSCRFHYEQTGHVFHAGESIKNLYGGKYHILEVLDPKNLLLMSENTGEILVGVDTEYFKRTPSGTYMPPRTVRSGGLNGDMGSILERVFQTLILKAYEAGMAFREEPGNSRQITRGKRLKDMGDKTVSGIGWCFL